MAEWCRGYCRCSSFRINETNQFDWARRSCDGDRARDVPEHRAEELECACHSEWTRCACPFWWNLPPRFDFESGSCSTCPWWPCLGTYKFVSTGYCAVHAHQLCTDMKLRESVLVDTFNSATLGQEAGVWRKTHAISRLSALLLLVVVVIDLAVSTLAIKWAKGTIDRLMWGYNPILMNHMDNNKYGITNRALGNRVCRGERDKRRIVFTVRSKAIRWHSIGRGWHFKAIWIRGWGGGAELVVSKRKQVSADNFD